MLRHQHLPLLAIFAQVCRDGSLTVAAQSLGLSKSVVSSHLRNLEELLDVRLLERTTRRLALTQAGDAVLSAANRMLVAADDVNRIGEIQRETPTGTLRVAAPVDLGALLIAPSVARLCAQYPKLQAELILSDDYTDFFAQRLDAMLTVNVPKDSSLVSTRLASDVEIIVSAPELAKRWRDAKQPKDLTAAPFIAHTHVPSGSRRHYRNSQGAKQRITTSPPRIVANTTDAIRSLVVAGIGFAVVPSQVVYEDMMVGRIVRMLPDWRGRTVHVHLCRPSQQHPPPRVVALVRELRNIFAITGFRAQYAEAAPRHALRYPP